MLGSVSVYITAIDLEIIMKSRRTQAEEEEKIMFSTRDRSQDKGGISARNLGGTFQASQKKLVSDEEQESMAERYM